MTFTFDSNMMHQQMNNMAVNQEFTRICAEYVGCIDCPLKGKDIDIQGIKVTCAVGMMKGETK